ncbi:hypothetical protein [Amycolatopsis sp. lyj-346]|uniref:hypothetical protein n=1 Tax=Amycolatopsis sp. lyj-346 TaxID=2789289 RepID=UPI0039797610
MRYPGDRPPQSRGPAGSPHGRRLEQLQRTDYNYFLSENGAGCGGAIAVTDIYGERLVVDPLPVKADVVQPTSRQFNRH